jgi:N-methylhydantoinase B
MPSAVKAILKFCAKESIDLNPGDMMLCNDPFITGSHTWDLMIVSPVFHQGEIIAIVGNLAHHADIGEHKSHVAIEALDEGIRIPPVKIVKEGVLDNEILRLVKSNVRVEEIGRDLRAQIGSNRRGMKRLNEITKKKSVSELNRYMETLIGYSDKRLRNAISQLPEGKFSFEDFIEGDGISEDLVKIKVEVKVEDSEIKMDFTGTNMKTRGPINSPLPVTLACAGYIVKALIDPDVPSNEGVFRPLQIIAPENSLVNACYPAAVAYANSVTCMRIVDVIMGAFVELIPDRVCAASTGTMNALNIKGIDPSTKKFYGYIETYAGGWGAMKKMDGLDATHTHMTNTMNAPVEAIEIAYPLQVNRYGIIIDSGGAGKRRGGVGITREIEALRHIATLGGRGDRMKINPWGVQGGEEARGSNYYKKMKDGSTEILPSKFQGIQLYPGESIIIETAGGGGWGSPLEREPELVRNDVINGFISHEKANMTYNVELDEGNNIKNIYRTTIHGNDKDDS